MNPRIAPLAEPYEPAVAAQLTAMMPAGIAPIALFRTFAHNLPMTQAMHRWGSYELGQELSVPRRTREIVIDRTTARCRAEYEWGVHVAFFAERVRLTTPQLRSITIGDATDPCWTEPADRLVIELVDQLHDTADVDDDLWVRLTTTYRPGQILDIILLCGWYHAISFIARAARLPNEPFAPSFDSVTA
jgi:hypothetical protein